MRAECRIQLGAKAVDHGDDRNGNAGGDQTVFDGGRARLILHKREKRVFISWLLKVHTWLSELTQCPFSGPFGSRRNLARRTCDAVKSTAESPANATIHIVVNGKFPLCIWRVIAAARIVAWLLGSGSPNNNSRKLFRRRKRQHQIVAIGAIQRRTGRRARSTRHSSRINALPRYLGSYTIGAIGGTRTARTGQQRSIK